MLLHQTTRRLVIIGATTALGASLLAGGATAAEQEPGGLSPDYGEASAPRGPDKAGGVSAQVNYDQGATRRDATITSVSGDAAPSDAQRIARVTVTQDLQANRVRAVATYRQVPTSAADSYAYVYLGSWTGNQCVRQVLIAGQAVGPDAGGSFYNAQGNPSGGLGVTKSRSGASLTITSAVNSRIRAGDWDCAYAATVATNGTEAYQTFYAVDLTTTYVARPQISTVDNIQGNYKGKWTTVSLDVYNKGRADARGAKITASGKGLKFQRKTINLGTVGKRSTKYGTRFKVKLNGKKSRRATFTFRAAGGATSRVNVTIAQKPKPTRLKSLSGRYFWGNDPRNTRKGWDPRAVMFVNKKFAYVGFPPRGVPSCRKTTKNCKRYTYKGGRVKIAGSKRVKVSSEGFKRGRVHYSPLSLPRKNSKLSATLIHQDFRGCGVNPYCSTWTETLSMNKNRRFVITQTGIASIGYPGTGTISSRVGPNERGRYQVLSKGRIRLTYDSGKKVTKTIGIERDVRNKANPGGAGIVIGNVNYYRPRI